MKAFVPEKRNLEMRLLLLLGLCAPLQATRKLPRCARAPQGLLQMASTADRRVVASFEVVTIPSPAEGPPAQEITVVDLMPHISRILEGSGLRDGSVNVISRHTTTSITINEWESRLGRDLRSWLLQLAPPDDRSTIGRTGAGVSYAHNDIDTRPESADERQRCLDNGWDVDDPDELQRWRDQEPINAHSHLAAVGARPRRPAIVAPAWLVSRGSANGPARAL